MKSRKSEEQQSCSAQNKGGVFFHPDVKAKKRRLEYQEKSTNTNPKSQTLFTQNKTTSEEKESDVHESNEGASYSCSTSNTEIADEEEGEELLGNVGQLSIEHTSFVVQDIKSSIERVPSSKDLAPTPSNRHKVLVQTVRVLPDQLQDNLSPTWSSESKGEEGEASILSAPNSRSSGYSSCGDSEYLSGLTPTTYHTSPQLPVSFSGLHRQYFSKDPPVPSVTHSGHPRDLSGHFSATNTLPAHSHLQLSSTDSCWTRKMSNHLPHFHSIPSLSKIDFAKNNCTRAISLPDMLLKDSFEEFTPDVTVDENEETYSFQWSRPGLYQCSVTRLVFHMEGEGDVVYRIVSWNRRLLAQHHKKPAGPLFDIKCLQQSVCQLHLPHCEIRSTGGCEFLSVAHVNDEDIEFITPHQITETHVIINITGFSGFGNVKDEDSPPDPVQALVLLFYRPPTDPDPESLLNVLLLPKNIVLRDVLRTRKKLVGDERYIETPAHCKLLPKQEYRLSTSPEDDSVLVQPTEAEFDEESYDNYVPSFQVNLEKIMKNIKLFLRGTNSSQSVWERKVCLLSTGVRRTCGPSALILPSNERLMDIRTCFIDGISGPVLKSLLDKMFEKKVITDSERESADEMQNKSDKARFVIDTVRKKGEAASSEMIEFLCEVDPFLCEHLGLI